MEAAREYQLSDADLAQVDEMGRKKAEIISEIRKVIVSNNGSVLDQETFSSTALMYLLARLNQFLPRMEILSMETRPE